MERKIAIIGGGLAGSECALQLAARGVCVDLFEMRPERPTDVHKTGDFAELVCSNSLKSMKAESAAGMLKRELDVLGSKLYACARETSVAAGGALAVDRELFSGAVTRAIGESALIEVVRREVESFDELRGYAAIVVATGPLTSDALAASISALTGSNHMAFYDAAAPIVLADSLDYEILFRQSRYEDAVDSNGEQMGDYLNAPFTREEYDAFIEALLAADRVIARDFETSDLFQACQPIEEIARKGNDAPRFGTMKPVGLTDPRTGKRPWAALQLRAENRELTSYNLVGFQTNLKFGEQARVFRMIPGLENAEFARYGVMHRNTFIDAPRLLDRDLLFKAENPLDCPIYFAGQVGGTEGYCEAIRSGLHVALAVYAMLTDVALPELSNETAFGSLLAYATDPETVDYQPSHVNFGIIKPLDAKIKNKSQRYAAYAERGERALMAYRGQLAARGLI